MRELVVGLVWAVPLGVIATAMLDLWALLRRWLLRIALPDYGLVGRWLAGFARGQFRHDAVARAPRMPCERLIGWSTHYLVGIAFALLLLAWQGRAWLLRPTLGPALLVGVGTVLLPFLIMQPGMGAGLAARRMPNPAAARLQSLIGHAVFGVGLYVGGWLLVLLR